MGKQPTTKQKYDKGCYKCNSELSGKMAEMRTITYPTFGDW